MRSNIAAGNWKMNTDVEFGLSFIKDLHDKGNHDNCEVIIAAPYISLKSMVELKSNLGSSIKIAAQNCHLEPKGAFTGEISEAMLKSIGIDYVIIGHSERRQYFHETEDQLLAKIKIALENDLKVIYCCGEPLEVREAGTHLEYVADQLNGSVCQLSQEQLSSIVIAYEPIWAIGTGKTATSVQAQGMHHSIRNLLAKTFNEDTASSMSILYGGSVKPANAKEIFSQNDVDGGLVGGASLSVDSFYEISQSFPG